MRADVLSYARSEFAKATEPSEREFYGGMIDVCDDTFDVTRCPRDLDPVNESDYCEGGREALQRLRVATPTGRMQHGDTV